IFSGSYTQDPLAILGRSFRKLARPRLPVLSLSGQYAKAKKESAGIMKILQSLAADRKHPDSRMAFTALLRLYVPTIEPSEAEALLIAITKDNQTWLPYVMPPAKT